MPRTGERFRVRCWAFGKPENGWIEGDCVLVWPQEGRYSPPADAGGWYTPDHQSQYGDNIICWQPIALAP
jgi:hypothetical protein